MNGSMNYSNRRKAEFLDMPIGTAMNRLRKMARLRLLQRLGEDTCYRCGEKITSADNLSLDHKQDWLGRDSELFWDLDNIAFSHQLCNSLGADHSVGAHERGMASADKTRKIGPPGTSWCSGCQQFLPESDFVRNPSGRNGKHWYCKQCTKKQREKRHRGNGEAE